jgi:hypothetical protein
MNTVLTIFLAVLGSSGVSTVVVALLQRHWSKKDREDSRIDALVSAQQVMMIDRVRYLGRHYIEAGRIGLSDKENLTAMYNAYKALGGNGHLETVMNEVNRLEVKE